MQKVFVNNNNTATIVCSQCGNMITSDVSKYAGLDKRVIVKCRCNCGHNFEVSLEKRRQYRKETDLPGMYYHRQKNGEIVKGIMRVVNISAKGLQMKVNVEPAFESGETLRVEFHLDDKRRTFMDKEVIVRNVKKNLVGVSFAPLEGDDANLGFYLMS